MDQHSIELIAYGVPLSLIGLTIAVAVGNYVVRRVTAPRRIPVREDWMDLEQRHFFNPGALPRTVGWLLLSLGLVCGLTVGPYALGIAQDVSWYVREDWLAALFGSIIFSIVAWYVLRPKRPRCPSCKSAALDKELSLPPSTPVVRVYRCRPCQIVWLTTYNLYHDHGTKLSAPPHF